MMAAAQPFLSGAISKTINMPEESTIEDIMNAYIESWKLGLKAVAIYRDNSKRSQPLNAAGNKKEEKKAETVAEPEQRELFPRAQREKMPVERASVTHKFSVGGHEGYITVGMYADGRPGEIFIKMSKEGSTLSGVMDGLALTISLGLQYGVPLKVFVDKLVNTRFEPSGISANPNIRFATSVLDYIARWLGGRFISSDYLKLNGTTVQRKERLLTGCTIPLRAGHRSAPAQKSEPVSTSPRDAARRRANLLRMRHADGAERRVLQVRELREHKRMQLRRKGKGGRRDERTPNRIRTSRKTGVESTEGTRVSAHRATRGRVERLLHRDLSPAGQDRECARKRCWRKGRRP